MLAGCAIYEAVAEMWPADRLRVGDRGLREGMLLRMMQGKMPGKRRRPRRRSRNKDTGSTTAETPAPTTGQASKD